MLEGERITEAGRGFVVQGGPGTRSGMPDYGEVIQVQGQVDESEDVG